MTGRVLHGIGKESFLEYGVSIQACCTFLPGVELLLLHFWTLLITNFENTLFHLFSSQMTSGHLYPFFRTHLTTFHSRISRLPNIFVTRRLSYLPSPLSSPALTGNLFVLLSHKEVVAYVSLRMSEHNFFLPLFKAHLHHNIALVHQQDLYNLLF